MREEIEKEIKNLKKILKEGSLNPKYDKHFYKKMEIIKKNEEKKKQRIKEIRNKIEDRIKKIEEKFVQKLAFKHKTGKARDEKIKKLLQLLT